MDKPTQQWLDDVERALGEGPLTLDKIPKLVPKPAGAGKLKPLLLSQPERFEIVVDPEVRERWWVHARGRSAGGNVELEVLLQDLCMTAEAAHQRHLARDEVVRRRMEQMLRSKWRKASVQPFGSAASGLRVNSSDIDLCFTMPDEDGRLWDDEQRRPTSKATINAIAKMLRQSAAYSKIEPIAHARVPIVKVVDSAARLACDVVPNAALAWHNSRLLRSYVELEPLCARLILLVKMWASRRGVSSAMHGYLSSYAREWRNPPSSPILGCCCLCPRLAPRSPSLAAFCPPRCAASLACLPSVASAPRVAPLQMSSASFTTASPACTRPCSLIFRARRSSATCHLAAAMALTYGWDPWKPPVPSSLPALGRQPIARLRVASRVWTRVWTTRVSSL